MPVNIATASGWNNVRFFCDGLELNRWFCIEMRINMKNIISKSVGAMCQTDPEIAPHIGNPVGTGLIRVSSDSLEIDKRDKPIFFEKREM